MSKLGVYDNWEKLVDGVIDREKLHRLALCDSFSSTSTTSAASISRLNSTSSTFNYAAVIDVNITARGILAKPIQLAHQVIVAAGGSATFKQECAGLKSKTEKLATLLNQAPRASYDLYDRLMTRIIDDTEQVLAKALSLVHKCRGNGLMKRVFSAIPASAFEKMSSLLDNSIGDLSWLLRISGYDDNEYLGLPPIAANEPILVLIWEQIAILYVGSIDHRGDAAASLASIAGDNDRYRKLIIEEGGVGPLLKLVNEGKVEGQKNAARAIGVLGKDPESVEQIIHAGVCNVFPKMLRYGPAKVQAVVAWAVSELAEHYPNCQDLFAGYNVIILLVGHLAFEMVQEHSKYAVVSVQYSQPNPTLSLTWPAIRAKEMEDPTTKVYVKAMAARALWKLAKGNNAICRSITESRALLCLAVLLDKGAEEVQYNSAMALMEITAVAEEDSELRRTAFKPSSPACKAVVDQLFKIIEKADSDDLLVPCIKAIGNLAGTFRRTETRMINLIVRLLDEQKPEISREACIALTKFAYTDNYLHLDYAKAIIGAGGVIHLVQLVYFEQIVQSSALVLLCYIALHVPDSEEVAEAEVLAVLEWASKQAVLMQVEEIENLLPEAKHKLELYRSRKRRPYQFV